MRLEAEALKLCLGGTEILKDVSFNLGQHRFIGIVGPNGSGKSTLLKTFYKVLQPSCGYLKLDGVDSREISHGQCAKLLAVLPQQQAQEVELTVVEVVHMGRYPSKGFFAKSSEAEYQLIAKTLQELGLSHLAHRRLATLSGGERQLVLMARAIVQDTPCLLLDEPTNHLDIYHQITILDTISKLNKQVVVVFHDLSLAGKYCDYIYLMNSGCIAEKGSPEEVLTGSNIKSVYGLDVEIIKHPTNGHLVVLL